MQLLNLRAPVSSSYGVDCPPYLRWLKTTSGSSDMEGLEYLLYTPISISSWSHLRATGRGSQLVLLKLWWRRPEEQRLLQDDRRLREFSRIWEMHVQDLERAVQRLTQQPLSSPENLALLLYETQTLSLSSRTCMTASITPSGRIHLSI